MPKYRIIDPDTLIQRWRRILFTENVYYHNRCVCKYRRIRHFCIHIPHQIYAIILLHQCTYRKAGSGKRTLFYFTFYKDRKVLVRIAAYLRKALLIFHMNKNRYSWDASELQAERNLKFVTRLVTRSYKHVTCINSVCN